MLGQRFKGTVFCRALKFSHFPISVPPQGALDIPLLPSNLREAEAPLMLFFDLFARISNIAIFTFSPYNAKILF